MVTSYEKASLYDDLYTGPELHSSFVREIGLTRTTYGHLVLRREVVAVQIAITDAFRESFCPEYTSQMRTFYPLAYNPAIVFYLHFQCVIIVVQIALKVLKQTTNRVRGDTVTGKVVSGPRCRFVCGALQDSTRAIDSYPFRFVSKPGVSFTTKGTFDTLRVYNTYTTGVCDCCLCYGLFME